VYTHSLTRPRSTVSHRKPFSTVDPQADVLQIPADTSLIAVHATNHANQMPEIMVSDAAGLFTTGWKIWKCTTRPTRPSSALAADWMLPTFDDSSWQVAVTKPRRVNINGRAEVKNIEWSAAWISSDTMCEHVYFRAWAPGCSRIEKMPVCPG